MVRRACAALMTNAVCREKFRIVPKMPDKPLKPRPGMCVVCDSGRLDGERWPRRWLQARVVPGARALWSCALPRDALAELMVRHALRLRIDCVRSTVRHRPQRRPPRRPQTRRLLRLAQVPANRPDHRPLGDKGGPSVIKAAPR